MLATYNCSDTLQACLHSIEEQTYPEIELIVVDGASTDMTLDVIKANDTIISRWISEPDNGIYDAWNKALSMATGDWFYFIGADDKLHEPNSIACAIERIRELPKETLVAYGSVQLTRMDGRVAIIGADWSKIHKKMYSQMCIPHQGAFHSHALFKQFGVFDDMFKLAGDYKLIMRSLELRNPVFLEGAIVADQYAGGKSAQRRHRILALSEMRKVQVEIGLPIKFEWIWAYGKGLMWGLMSRFIDVKA